MGRNVEGARVAAVNVETVNVVVDVVDVKDVEVVGHCFGYDGAH